MSRIKHASHEPHVYPFSGVTLMFCVSDHGLRCLLNCRKLKKITMNRVMTHHPPRHNISLNGVRHLILGLPDLEYVFFGSIGKILDQREFGEPQEPLRLTYYCEMDTKFVNVPKIQRFCPNIQHIYISDPLVISNSGTVR